MHRRAKSPGARVRRVMDRSIAYRRAMYGCVIYRCLMGAAVLCVLAVATASAPGAQQRVAPGPPSIITGADDSAAPPAPEPAGRAHGRIAAPALQPDPDLDAEDQLAPSQIIQPMPGAVAAPSGGGRERASARPAHAMVEPGAPRKSSHAADLRAVACSGVFGRDSSHAKLAMAFQSRNVVYTQVDAASGAKVMASVLFAKDPKRRLEMWWANPASRSETHLIVINGASIWTAPGDLRLGLTLAQVEQLNRKPFKLLGFNKDGVATLTDWNSGELAVLPGGCKVGISLRPAATASAAAVKALPADREYASSDAALRAVNPTVSEILIAY
jgi:hypothetical protein